MSLMAAISAQEDLMASLAVEIVVVSLWIMLDSTFINTTK